LSLMTLAILTGCKTTQKTVETTDADARKSGVIRSHEASRDEFNTMTARLGMKYTDERQSHSVTVNLRLKKGEVIWMSASMLGITGAKIMITPTEVKFYEKLNNRAFEGNFAIIERYLGEPLTYQQMEDILLGHAMEPLDDYEMTVREDGYRFIKNDLIARLIQLRPEDFRVERQQLLKADENSTLSIVYDDYKQYEGRTLPTEIKVDAVQGTDSRRVEIFYRSVDFDEELRFPFSFPSGAKFMDL